MLGLQQVYPELVRHFDLQKDITLDVMRKLALNLESTDAEAKARIDKGSVNMSVNVAESRKLESNSKKAERISNRISNEKCGLICFNCGKPNQTAKACRNQRTLL